ncbi:hypothetical protein DFH08DRAFT_882572 [Mycena albidolilacea]|uniref:Uncharacterized protein n=1 Tax=Mycena albidolilacea TaxID=1033008 RepID=A0AAD6ZN00_9AGAR|nr:hypothetical protein DFH08DRAFT_882572 [Mycena albidolilacea]
MCSIGKKAYTLRILDLLHHRPVLKKFLLLCLVPGKIFDGWIIAVRGQKPTNEMWIQLKGITLVFTAQYASDWHDHWSTGSSNIGDTIHFLLCAFVVVILFAQFQK